MKDSFWIFIGLFGCVYGIIVGTNPNPKMMSEALALSDQAQANASFALVIVGCVILAIQFSLPANKTRDNKP